MTAGKAGELALLWRGNRETGAEATSRKNRFNAVFEALTALGIRAEPAIYADDKADDVREQLLKLDGALVWVDPISNGQSRTQLGGMSHLEACGSGRVEGRAPFGGCGRGCHRCNQQSTIQRGVMLTGPKSLRLCLRRAAVPNARAACFRARVKLARLGTLQSISRPLPVNATLPVRTPPSGKATISNCPKFIHDALRESNTPPWPQPWPAFRGSLSRTCAGHDAWLFLQALSKLPTRSRASAQVV
jgi:hypothetical protein